MHYRSIIRILGALLCINALALLFPALFAFFEDGEGFHGFLVAFVVSMSSGCILLRSRHRKEPLDSVDGCCTATLGWAVIGLYGALPYYLILPSMSFTDAIFESVSGFTTTGATVLTDVEALPRALLLWRSMTQWLGGMGILVLALAILPYFNSGGMNLFIAESPGPQVQKITPRIEDSSKMLWLLYGIITVTAFLYMLACGLSWFDALNHALTTAATGGFSTKNSGVAYFGNPYLEWGMIVFMLVASINFVLHLNLFKKNRKFIHYFLNSELRFYLALILMACLGIVFAGMTITSESMEGDYIRSVIFQVVSIASSSGFVAIDYAIWPVFSKAILLILIFMGGCSGSTSGGVKAIRILLVFKYVFIQILKMIHPNIVKYVKVDRNKDLLEPRVVNGIISFLMLYWLIFSVSFLIVSWDSPDLETSFSSVISALSNIGPALGATAEGNYADFGNISKWVLALDMLLGRLELITTLVLFFPQTWKR